jgi:hypothetical protein
MADGPRFFQRTSVRQEFRAQDIALPFKGGRVRLG